MSVSLRRHKFRRQEVRMKEDQMSGQEIGSSKRMEVRKGLQRPREVG
jgi:hypothetical protein